MENMIAIFNVAYDFSLFESDFFFLQLLVIETPIGRLLQLADK